MPHQNADHVEKTQAEFDAEQAANLARRESIAAAHPPTEHQLLTEKTWADVQAKRAAEAAAEESQS